LAVITLLMAMGSFTRFYLVSWLGERVSNDVRLAVFNHLLTLDPYFFEVNRSGEINARLTTDTTLLQSIIGSSISMALRNVLTFVGGLVMMLITNPKLALIVLASVPLIIFPMVLYGRRVRKLSRLSQDRVVDIGTYAGEIVQNIKVVQSFTREKEETKAFGQEVEKAFDVAKKRILQRSILIVVAMILVFTGLSSMIWVGAQDVANGHISSGELAAFVFYALMVAMAVATISEVYGELQRAAGATERLLELLAEEADIQLAVDTCRKAGNNDIILLKCTSSYPAPLELANLRTIPDLKSRFGVEVGFSDHTYGSLAPTVATSLGAAVIEKHFILDKSIGGPDADFSLDVEEFTDLVNKVRDTEKLLGKVSYEISEKVKNNKKFARSLFVVEDVQHGDTITEENVRSIRPGYGLHPKYYKEVLGKRVVKDIERGTPLSFKMIDQQITKFCKK